MYKNFEKVQSFNQGNLIDKLRLTYGKIAEEKDIIKEISDGFCYMLSIEWALSVLDNSEKLPNKVFNTDFDNEVNLAYYKQIANNFYENIKKFKLTINQISPYKVLNAGELKRDGKEFRDYLYVDLCSNTKHKVKDIFYKDTNYGFDTTEIDCVGIIGMFVNNIADKKKSYGHEMAFCNIKNHAYLFDPNAGVFKTRDLSKLIPEITDTYKDSPGEKFRFVVAHIA